MCKETVVVQLNSMVFVGGTEKNHEKPQDSSVYLLVG